MFEPTQDEYGRPVWTPNDPVVRTADGKPIVHGMRVFTNNLDRGVVDLTGDLTGRGANYEWHGVEKRWVLWFEVVCSEDYKGNAYAEGRAGWVLQSDDRVATRYDGKEA